MSTSPMPECKSHHAQARNHPCFDELSIQPANRGGEREQPSQHPDQACQLAEHRPKIEGRQVGAQRHGDEAYTGKARKITSCGSAWSIGRPVLN